MTQERRHGGAAPAVSAAQESQRCPGCALSGRGAGRGLSDSPRSACRARWAQYDETALRAALRRACAKE